MLFPPSRPGRGVRRCPCSGNPAAWPIQAGAARRHLCLHFTRCPPTRRRSPGHRARFRALRYDPKPIGTWTVWPDCFRAARSCTPQWRSPRRRAARASNWPNFPALVLAHPRASNWPSGWPAPGPGDLNRCSSRPSGIISGRVGLEAGRAVFSRPSAAGPDTRCSSPGQIAYPRHDRWRLASPGCRDQGPVEAAPAGGVRVPPPTSTGRRFRGRRPSPGSALGAASRARHPGAGPESVPRCSWSRCRIPAVLPPAASPATSTGSARSATATRHPGLRRVHLRVRAARLLTSITSARALLTTTSRHHHLAKGVTSGYAPLGGMMVATG